MIESQPRARWIILAAVLVLSTSGTAWAQSITNPTPGRWSAGGGIGFLGATPSGTAFALNANADYFLHRYFSVGPLMQVAFTGSLTQFGLSGQGKYWFDIPDTANRAKLVLQGGLGFIHADRLDSDTSWLIPLGVGIDYAMTEKLALTATFLLNFTDLDTGHGKDAHVMPGLTFGVRF
jgi:Outer membrane protein beta-barrel domain